MWIEPDRRPGTAQAGPELGFGLGTRLAERDRICGSAETELNNVVTGQETGLENAYFPLHEMAFGVAEPDLGHRCRGLYSERVVRLVLSHSLPR